MYRVDDTTASATLPALPTDNIGQPGYFQGGSLSGAAPTRVRFWWLNQIQEEIIAPIAAAGIALVKGTNNQLLTALQKLFSPIWTTTSGTTQLPSGLIVQTFATPAVQLGAANQSVEYNFNFPQPFPNGVISISAHDAGNACISWGSFFNLTKTGGSGYAWSGIAGTQGATATGYITAIGY